MIQHQIFMGVSTLLAATVALNISPATAQSDPPAPNIILVNLDDADSELLAPAVLAERFPNLNRFARQATWLAFNDYEAKLMQERTGKSIEQLATELGVKLKN